MSLFDAPDENAIYLSRTDNDDPLSSYAMYSFELEDLSWPSVEHYFQAMKFEDVQFREKIRQTKTAKKARSLGRSRFHKVRSDWKKIREVIMTRAVYIKCRTHDVVSQKLLETGESKLVENNLYDYFWGCGRDRRGENTYGKVLMNVRDKLKEEETNTP